MADHRKAKDNFIPKELSSDGYEKPLRGIENTYESMPASSIMNPTYGGYEKPEYVDLEPGESR